MKKFKFVKYNRTRREAFQIRTSILEEDGVTWVEKAALTDEGITHIRSFAYKYDWLTRLYGGEGSRIKMTPVAVGEDGRTARFDFLTGSTLAELLGGCIIDGKFQREAVLDALALVFEVKEGDGKRKFRITPEFEEVFGRAYEAVGQEQFGRANEANGQEQFAPTIEAGGQEQRSPSSQAWSELTEDWSMTVSNIDALFENLMLVAAPPLTCVCGEAVAPPLTRVPWEAASVYCLDYEWVFSFPIPVSFIKYRILYYLYEQYKSVLTYSCLSEFLGEFRIGEGAIEIYRAMEEQFQNYVHGENQQIYLVNYMHETIPLSEDMYELTWQIEDAKKRMARGQALELEMKEKELTICKQQELKRLTDNHVVNLEMMIAELRRSNAQMADSIAYLNRHEALVFKVRRKIANAFNRSFPKGTRKRKLLGYAWNTVVHPISSFHLYTTGEGRNLIEGDMKIGEGYRVHGKLHFPRAEQPLVSIVIPVYNQITYTYICLLSILEHTKDVSYEIIIADDVSTDATAELAKFADNLVICRNETNQGFLRNCNKAAKAAKGVYVMFLNNDTQVTDGWLSALVRLIESDDSIGMVGSKLVYPDGRLQEAGGILWSDGSGWNYGRLDDPEKPEYNYVKDVDYISGAAILLSNQLWKEIGGFDDRFAPAYCEDSDLAFEVRKAGYRVVYQPLSKVIHYEGVSNGVDVNGGGLKRYQVENSRKLKEKWSEDFARQCENNGNPDPFRARERSMGKKIILVVDHYVPTYDRDAGSKTTFQYLKMFLEKGYVIKFLGDNFLHEEPYSTALQQMGIEILYGPEYQVKIWDWIKEHKDEIGFAYLNRPHIATKYVDFIEAHTNIKMIYYGHDLHFLREGREYELTGDPAKLEASEYWKAIEFRLMRKAAVSYYPSCVERDAIHAIDPAIRVKDIVAYVYEEFLTELSEDFAKREGLLFVGGFAHPPNADAVLWFAREVFPLIRQKLSVPFYIVGSKVTEEILALAQPGNGIVVKGFVSEEELGKLYRESRVVVVPLRYGAGVKGKVIEAIYNGAPIVTTAIGAEGIPHAEEVMAIANEPEAFAESVVSLYGDVEECRRLCVKTQSYIREYYSIDAAWRVVGEDFT